MDHGVPVAAAMSGGDRIDIGIADIATALATRNAARDLLAKGQRWCGPACGNGARVARHSAKAR